VRKKVMAVVFAVLAFSLIAASAASLGPINASDVGANTGTVAACDSVTGVDVEFTTTLDGANGPRVTAALVSGIHDDCVGLDLFIELQDGAFAALGAAGPVTVAENGAGADDNFRNLTGFSVDPEALENVYVVIG
jgi:hypothetical protein